MPLSEPAAATPSNLPFSAGMTLPSARVAAGAVGDRLRVRVGVHGRQHAPPDTEGLLQDQPRAGVEVKLGLVSGRPPVRALEHRVHAEVAPAETAPVAL